MVSWADTDFVYSLGTFQVDFFLELQILQLPFIEYLLGRRDNAVLAVYLLSFDLRNSPTR